MTLTICQIVPQLPPAINGVGNYALSLARQLRQDYQVETHFLVCDPTWQGHETMEGFRVSQIKERQAKYLSDCISLISTPKLLLHYVNYGYAKRGCPLWLIEGLKQIKRELSPRLVTMFHEVYAFSPYPWHSSFWLSPLQKKIASELLQITDSVFTSIEIMAQIITQISPSSNEKLTILPVFSNIGECENILPLDKREKNLVVFGSKNSRTQVYKECLKSLIISCKSLAIEKIYDIGVPTGINFSSILKINVIEKGVLPSSEISEILSRSIAGFMNFPPPDLLGKSTVFATICGHGVLPILSKYPQRNRDGLVADKHYKVMTESSQIFNLETAQDIASAAHKWYSDHSIAKQTKVFFNKISDFL